VGATLAAFFVGKHLTPTREIERDTPPLGTAFREQPALFFILFGIFGVMASGALVAFAAAPSNWDSLTYHLARVGYYLQQGSLDDFGANFFAQEQQARGASILQCALITISGKSDRLVGLPQLAAYVLCLCEVYVLARWCGRSQAASLAAAGVFGSLTIVAMEAPTPQNDLLLASFLGAGVVGTLLYLAEPRPKSLFLAAGGYSLALAIKASALTCGLGLAVIVVAAARITVPSRRDAVRRTCILILSTLLLSALLAWPAGYWKNWLRHGNPLGGPEMIEIHMKTGDAASRWHTGLLNVVRFGADFATCDGLPESWLGEPGSSAKARVGAWLKQMSFDPEAPTSVRSPFSWSRPRLADENVAYFGLLGPAILFPGCLAAWSLRKREPLTFGFALAFAFFFVGQAFAGPYDPWRGRLFLYGAIFAAPAAAWVFDSPRHLLRRAAWWTTAAGALAVLPALAWRSPNPLISRPGAPSVLNLDRLQQMSLHHPSHPALVAFDQIVPRNAILVVALPGNEYEYPLFGDKFGRQLIPQRRAREQPELAGTESYLLYDSRLMAAKPTDIPLGYFWAVRPPE